MRTRHTQRANQRGISLVEMAVAVAIVAVILVGVLLGIQKLQFDRRLNNARADIQATITNLSGVYATQPTTQGATTQTLSLMNVWPKERVTNAGLPAVKVDGHFQNSTELVFGNNKAFPPRITQVDYQGLAYWLTNVPSEACLPLLQAMVANGSVAAVAVVPAATNPTATVALTQLGAYTSGRLTLNMTTATTACSSTGNKHVVAVVARA